MKKTPSLLIALFCSIVINAQEVEKQPADYVNPFIGTSNYGATNPGAVAPHGMMSVTPFNATGSDENKFDKDRNWWSMPYEPRNTIMTGFSHVNLSGVGCPDLASLLLMPTTGELEVDINKYGSPLEKESATPGYYTAELSRYGVKSEVTATMRTSVARFSFPKGKANILMNLGEGLTNETGAFLRKVACPHNGFFEIEGYKLQGTFCFTRQQAVFPLYFVMRVENKSLAESGYWKKQRFRKGYKEEWDPGNGKYKLYTEYDREIAGDNIGAWFKFDLQEAATVEVRIGVSFVSIDNARENLDSEQHFSNGAPLSFDSIRTDTFNKWNSDLSKISVKGGSQDDKIVFYTAAYHTLIHPNVLQDVNGEYPAMESGHTLKVSEGRNRYTVFSLWDTYRTLHQYITLLYPDRQSDMLRSMVAMYKESGWLPKWELYSRETLTMEGDPAIPVITDSYLKGLRDFDVEAAYEAMIKSAVAPGAQNPLRPDNDDYLSLGYVPLREQFDNSVSHALEYYVADWNIGQLAKALGHEEDALFYQEKSLGYKHYYSPEFGTLRPILPNGEFYSPFNPLQGLNFEPNPGFHEGNAWNYTFAIPHDVQGLMKLMGGSKKFVDKLSLVFEKGYFDPTNEPDIIYPYLFSYCKGEEWRTQKAVKEILDKHYKTDAAGLPGNDDTGTLSSWALFSMLGIYPVCPGNPIYAITTPRFEEAVITIDSNYYPQSKSGTLTIRKVGKGDYIRSITIDGKRHKGFFISHEQLTTAKEIIIHTK